jgi:alpha-L-fucosidase
MNISKLFRQGAPAALALLLAFCKASAQPAPESSDTASADPYAHETPAQRDARMKWWREARFGMFIHWGVYSVPAGTYDGKRIEGIGEWIMNHGKIPVARYREYAKEFNPVKYNADQWVSLAKAAGMKYIVITSKHHDGFAMFDSKASDWNIVKATPFGRDPLKELAAACEKQGLRLGFYYSQAQDWNNPGGAAAGGHWDKAQDGSMDDYIRDVAAPQMKEILTHYGKISVLWFDTPGNFMNKERASMILPALRLQPGIIYNNRLGGGFKGDTETPEQRIPATGYPGRDWETCMTMNDTWGFKSYDDHWKSVETIIHNLVDIASKGGNYLLNVGPTSEGLIPAPSVERLQAVGQWMKLNGVAIYDTTASPFKSLPWGRCTKQITADGATLYLHVFKWPKDGKLDVPGLKNKVTESYLLTPSGNQQLETVSGGDGVTVGLALEAPDPISSTVVLKIMGTPEIEQPLLSQDYDGSISLPSSEAHLHGGDIQTENVGGHDNIGYWTETDDWCEWQFKVAAPGKFNVTADAAAEENGSVELSVGESKLQAAVNATGSYEKYKTVKLGSIEIAKEGVTTLALHPVKEGWHPLNVRSLKLAPSQSFQNR